MALLDVDRLPEAMAVSRLTSYNRWNWAAFDERDHLGDPSQPLRERLRASAAASGEALPDGPVYLLTHLRYRRLRLQSDFALLLLRRAAATCSWCWPTCSNTYGGRRHYWLRPADDGRRRFRAAAAKALYVSPFMESDVDYEFILTPPGRVAAGRT